eukprot:m.72864 g.72864  ORF g.72864 m.72864 type:complete len:349 (+) comp14288_c0_seq1:31-1077(+)
MARTARKSSKKTATEIDITFPSSWAEFNRMIANNPGDSFAIVACVFVLLYMWPVTSSFAEPIVTITHNVTDPAELKDREWMEYVPGIGDMFFTSFMLLIFLAVHEGLTDFVWGPLGKHIRPKFSWRSLATDLLGSTLAMFALMEGLGQTWRPDGIGYVWLVTTPSRMSMTIKLALLLYIVLQLQGVFMVFGNKWLAKAKTINSNLLIHFGLQAGGAILAYAMGYPRVLAVAIVISAMTKGLPGLARLLAPLVLKTVEVAPKAANGKKKDWFKNETVGSKEIVITLAKFAPLAEVVGLLATLGYIGYVCFFLGAEGTGLPLAGLGCAIMAVGASSPLVLPVLQAGEKAH